MVGRALIWFAQIRAQVPYNPFSELGGESGKTFAKSEKVDVQYSSEALELEDGEQRVKLPYPRFEYVPAYASNGNSGVVVLRDAYSLNSIPYEESTTRLSGSPDVNLRFGNAAFAFENRVERLTAANSVSDEVADVGNMSRRSKMIQPVATLFGVSETEFTKLTMPIPSEGRRVMRDMKPWMLPSC